MNVTDTTNTYIPPVSKVIELNIRELICNSIPGDTEMEEGDDNWS